MDVMVHSKTPSNQYSEKNGVNDLTSHHNCEEVEIRIGLFKGARSLGVEFSTLRLQNDRGQDESQILIKHIAEGGLIGSDGRIKIGDRLLAVKQYLDTGDSLTFHFEDVYAGDDTCEVKQILKRCKGRLEITISRKINQATTSSPTHFKNSNIARSTTSETRKTSVYANLDVCNECNLSSSPSGDKGYENSYRDSTAVYKMKKCRRQNISKRYGLSSEDQCHETFKPVVEESLVSKMYNITTPFYNCVELNYNIVGRFKICIPENVIHNFNGA